MNEIAFAFSAVGFVWFIRSQLNSALDSFLERNYGR